ncbi:hypothetical protein KKB18_05395 [bacterium]|nr:hypothetical protein [bacterium]
MMTMHIFPKKIKGKTYYYLQSTYREKLKSSDKGKVRGSGKSRVRTKSVYLGTAESILERLQKKDAPIGVKER